MKKLITSAILIATIFTFPQKVSACETQKLIPISRIEVLQGVISNSDSEYTYIDTLDGNGWVILRDDYFAGGENVMIVFDTMGTNCIFDDEIIQIVKIEMGL